MEIAINLTILIPFLGIDIYKTESINTISILKHFRYFVFVILMCHYMALKWIIYNFKMNCYVVISHIYVQLHCSRIWQKMFSYVCIHIFVSWYITLQQAQQNKNNCHELSFYHQMARTTKNVSVIGGLRAFNDKITMQRPSGC